jgi:hypothetical protein
MVAEETRIKAGYLFRCGSKTQDECFRRRLLASISKHWESVKKIKPLDLLFLYNIKSKDLIGPFTAESEGGWEIDSEAWAYMRPIKFPAQVRVNWNELHVLRNADNHFKFLSSRETCELTEEQTDALLSALSRAPPYTPSISDYPPFNV